MENRPIRGGLSFSSALVRKQGIECEITEYANAGDYFSSGVEYDILFLDIELDGHGQGMDGMGMARQIRGMEDARQPVIIFVTGYEKYVYDAFDVGAFQYLLKPVDERKFAKVFERAVKQAVSDAEQGKKVLIIQYGSTGNNVLFDRGKKCFEGEIVMDADTNLPISTKGNRNDSLHGIGLSNVKREAEKYMGDVDIKVKKSEFSVTVMWQERRQE